MTHPAVLEEYRKAGAEILSNADDNLESEFFSGIIEGSERTRIDSIIRKSVRGKGEFILYSETLIGENINGNKRYLSRHEQGRYDLPVFQKVFDPQSGVASNIPKVARHEETYEFPFSPETIKDIMARDQFNSDFAMLLDLGHVKYSVRDRNDFISLPEGELMKKIETYY